MMKLRKHRDSNPCPFELCIYLLKFGLSSSSLQHLKWMSNDTIKTTATTKIDPVTAEAIVTLKFVLSPKKMPPNAPKASMTPVKIPLTS